MRFKNRKKICFLRVDSRWPMVTWPGARHAAQQQGQRNADILPIREDRRIFLPAAKRHDGQRQVFAARLRAPAGQRETVSRSTAA